MYSETKLESSFGGIVFNIYYFPSWIKGLYTIFGSLALLSNSVCLGYICKRLNLTNAVNLIPLMECFNNIIGFCIIAVINFIAFVDSSFQNLTCRVNIPVLGMMFICSKSCRKNVNNNLMQDKLILKLISGHVIACFLSVTRYIIVRKGADSIYVKWLKLSFAPILSTITLSFLEHCGMLKNIMAFL